MNGFVPSIAAGAVAFVVAGVLVPLLVRFAVGRNLLDVPNPRSSHETPTPRLGGLAVIAGAWVGALLAAVSGVGLSSTGWVILIAASLVGAVGLVDDLGNLHFATKAAGQAAVALGLLVLLPPPLVEATGGVVRILLLVLGAVWIVALVNAFNFMDGIDGIVGGTALVNALFLFSLPHFSGAGVILASFCGAVAGFLLWNIGPASIFLGDAGSHFVGLLLAAAALYAPVVMSGGGFSPVELLACALVFTPFLLDTAYTLVVRIRAGKNVFSAHREHIYQRITPSPAMHRRTSNLYYGAAVVAGLAAILVSGDEGWTFLVGVALTVALCVGLMLLPKLLVPR